MREREQSTGLYVITSECEPLSLSSDYCVNHPTKAHIINAPMTHRPTEAKREHAGWITADTHDAPTPSNVSPSCVLGFICELVPLTSQTRCRISFRIKEMTRPSPLLGVFFFRSPSQRKPERLRPHTPDLYNANAVTASRLYLLL